MNARPVLIPLAAAVALLCAGPARALDFTLRTTQVEEDGFRKELTYFQGDERTRIYISLPRNWANAVDAASLTLTAPGAPNRMIRLEKSALAPTQPFKDRGLETYRQRALALIPQGTTGARVAEERDNPLPIMGWQSFEFILAYDFFGQAFRKSVVFVNVNPKEQLVVTGTSLQGDFEATRTGALDVMRSWQPEAVK